MAAEILKTIKVNVDSREYKAFLSSMEKVAEIEKKIAKAREMTSEEYEFQEKKLKETISLERKKLKSAEKLTELEKAQSKATIEQTKRQLTLIKLSKELQKAKKDLAKDERAAALKAKRDEISSRPLERLRKMARSKAEEGRESALGLGLRYGKAGITAPFLLQAERAQEQGDKAVAAIDEQIAQNADAREANVAEIEKLQGDLNDPNMKMSKAKRAAAQSRIDALNAENASLDKEGESLKDKRSQTIGDTKTQVSKYQAMGEAAQRVAGGLKKVADKLLTPFKQLADAAKQAVHELLSFKSGVATFNTQASLVTNASARDQQMKYGLTSSQNYAFTQAKSMLGIESDEDLMYMNSEQRERLLGYMSKYSAWYDQLESSGVLSDIQEMGLEFRELKQELAMEFLRWVAANKETIMACIKGIFEFVKGIANLVMSIMNLLTFGRYKDSSIASISDSTNNNYNNSQKNTVINVNANTTNNATGVLGSQEALDQYNKENFSKLAKQIVGAIGG